MVRISDNDGAYALPRSIGQPAMRALTLAGWTDLRELSRHREQELLSLHGVGPKAVGILRLTMAELDLAFMPQGGRS